MKLSRETIKRPIMKKCHNQLWMVILASFLFWFILLHFFNSTFIVKIPITLYSYNFAKNSIISAKSNHYQNEVQLLDEVSCRENGLRQSNPQSLSYNTSSTVQKHPRIEVVPELPRTDSCSGRYIYIHKLPNRFNDALLENCTDYTCEFTNHGLGPRLWNVKNVYSNNGWFATNQFSLEVLFHNRMKQYKCLTNDSSLASAIFIPYYAGLDIDRHLWGSNTSMRDSDSLELVKWLREKTEWKKMWGRDHFSVAGRITWDFRRSTEEETDWGNKFLNLTESKNMTVLLIESSPWHKNDFAIPYPTYFHPSIDNQVFQWQNRMRKQRRPFLFAFAGAPRPKSNDSIRNEIINQCRDSRKKCKLLECKSSTNKCNKPFYVVKMFESSVFCLQPQGDSYTRRSAFDSILAGCIPVFFHPGSAYVQYVWHLPKDYNKYSVFIPERDVKEGKVSIMKILLEIPKKEVIAMREEVIKLIPRIVYADPKYRLEKIEDAFDITVKEVLEKVEKIRREMKEGKKASFDYEEEFSWKYKLLGRHEGVHEWDSFFEKM